MFFRDVVISNIKYKLKIHFDMIVSVAMFVEKELKK